MVANIQYAYPVDSRKMKTTPLIGLLVIILLCAYVWSEIGFGDVGFASLALQFRILRNQLRIFQLECVAFLLYWRITAYYRFKTVYLLLLYYLGRIYRASFFAFSSFVSERKQATPKVSSVKPTTCSGANQLRESTG
jgi:hypothetical protein